MNRSILKRNLCVLTMIIIALLLISCGVKKRVNSDTEYAIAQFSEELLSYDFDRLSCEKDSHYVTKVILSDDVHSSIDTVSLPESLIGRIYDIRYQDGNIYYVLSVVVDDESGVIFSKCNCINLNGLSRIERIDRNLFLFATY